MSELKKTVSLVLGSGGARGLAHIGVIRELLARGYDIRAISGSSMGAVVGGIHAAGGLDAYEQWVTGLAQSDVRLRTHRMEVRKRQWVLLKQLER